MTQAFHASEARITSFLDSIRHGRPIDNGRPWSVLDLLTLAGCAHCAIMSHPPGWIDREDLEAMDSEKREAVEATHTAEVTDTVLLLSRVAFEALNGNLNGNLNEGSPNSLLERLKVSGEVKGVLAHGEDGQPRVQLAE